MIFGVDFFFGVYNVFWIFYDFFMIDVGVVIYLYGWVIIVIYLVVNVVIVFFFYFNVFGWWVI